MQGPRHPSHAASRDEFPNVAFFDARKAKDDQQNHNHDHDHERNDDDDLNDAPEASTAAPTDLPLHSKAQDPNRHDDPSPGGGGGGAGGSGAQEDGLGERTPKRPGAKRVAAMTVTFLKRHLAFLGPGLIASVAYFDPGNWATDLSAGTKYRYSHLFVVLLAGLMAILLQILACRLGIVTRHDLAEHCRMALHDRPKNKMFWRWGVLYPLYFLSESAIIFTDLAELIGSAIAINLLIPQIPLWGGVLLTGVDVLIVLAFFNSYPSRTADRSVRLFELVIGLLVLIVLACFIVLLARVGPEWGDVFRGYAPSSGIIADGGLYIAVGIVGATVMPHAIFLGSKLATIERMAHDDSSLSQDDEPAKKVYAPEDPLLKTVAPAPPRRRGSAGPSLHMPHPVRMPQAVSQRSDEARQAQNEEESDEPKLGSVPFINTHVRHASLDIGLSLFCFALVINSAILILAGTAFHSEDPASRDSVEDGDLFAAHELIKVRVGQAPAFLFAIALLLSGQAASITATLAGQTVSEGFINWRTRPWLRRLITRCIGIIPSLVIAIAAGRKGLDTLLVASQVALSIVLPFVLFPLLLFTSQKHLMVVPTDPDTTSLPVVDANPDEPSPSSPAVGTSSSVLPTSSPTTFRRPNASGHQRTKSEVAWQTVKTLNPIRKRSPPPAGFTSYANAPSVIWLGAGIFVLVCVANVYAIVQLGMGHA